MAVAVLLSRVSQVTAAAKHRKPVAVVIGVAKVRWRRARCCTVVVEVDAVEVIVMLEHEGMTRTDSVRKLSGSFTPPLVLAARGVTTVLVTTATGLQSKMVTLPSRLTRVATRRSLLLMGGAAGTPTTVHAETGLLSRKAVQNTSRRLL